MQAIILAAGKGKRLKERTAYNTKCMVELGGVTLIERALRLLDCGEIDKITIVCGYCKSKLKAFVDSLCINTPIAFVDNDDYENTNNIYSLGLAVQSVGAEDMIVMESDIVFEKRCFKGFWTVNGIAPLWSRSRSRGWTEISSRLTAKG